LLISGSSSQKLRFSLHLAILHNANIEKCSFIACLRKKSAIFYDFSALKQFKGVKRPCKSCDLIGCISQKLTTCLVNSRNTPAKSTIQLWHVQIFAHSLEICLTEYKFSATIIDRTYVLFDQKSEKRIPTGGMPNESRTEYAVGTDRAVYENAAAL
jgi:hypothetical protein